MQQRQHYTEARSSHQAPTLHPGHPRKNNIPRSILCPVCPGTTGSRAGAHHGERCTTEGFVLRRALQCGKTLHQRALHYGNLYTTESFEPRRAWHHGKLCIMACVAPRRALYHGLCRTTVIFAPRRALHHSLCCTTESFAPRLVLHHGELCTTASFAPRQASYHGLCCTMASFVPQLVSHHGELCTTASFVPRRALQEPLAPAPLPQHTQPQLTRGPAATRGSPSPALTPRFPHLELAPPPAAPLRGEEGSAMAGVF